MQHFEQPRICMKFDTGEYINFVIIVFLVEIRQWTLNAYLCASQALPVKYLLEGSVFSNKGRNVTNLNAENTFSLSFCFGYLNKRA